MASTLETAVGTTLPELSIKADTTFVVSALIATRDFQDVHHDRDLAQHRGSKDIFANILTDTGLVQRFVTDWAGPKAVIKSIALRLGVPWYAYDTLTLSGTAASMNDGVITLDIVGRNGLGDHITSTVTLVLNDQTNGASA
ncbi:MaoC family dehydratase [Rhodococcus marinonascens]|uniref:MaoC family dehydratase n=1 Tax=Rhodococcus marinonascens TaxID=38311 RepID=UPI00093411D8|nr:MaoC family dehydratase [Rhodococcus marinonascens]